MKFEAKPANVDALERLTQFFQNTDRDEMSWEHIEAETDVKMSASGRRLVYRALRKESRPYRGLPGYGIALSSPENAIDILQAKTGRIRSALDNACTTQEQLQARHAAKMSGADASRLISAGAFLGAVRAAVLGDRVLKT